MKRFLVTGGCGFIGSNFVRYLLSNHSDVFVCNLDKLTYAGNVQNLKEFEGDSRYQLVKGDVCDLSLLRNILARTDIVVHFASETHVDRSILSSEDFINTNVVGTRVLLDAVIESGRIEKLIHFSTDEVYGAIAQGVFSEESPFRPTSPYAASKAAADLLVQSYCKTYKVPAIVLRGSNNFGPFQFPEKVIPLFVTNLLEGKKVPLYSRGENSREWIFVEDTCRAIDLVLKKGVIGEAYNVGSDFEITNLELTRAILKILNKTESEINFVQDRPGHDLRYRLNSGKLKRLGFAVAAPFHLRVEETIKWYIQNQSWWEALKKDRFTIK